MVSRGSIHTSQLGLDRGEDLNALFQIDQVVEAEVTNIDREERRISLSIRAIKKRSEKEQNAQYMEDSGPAVTFGDLLREKMDSGSEE